MPPKVGRRPAGRLGLGAKAKAAPKAGAPAAKVKAKAKANPRRRAAAKSGAGGRRRILEEKDGAVPREEKLARGLSLEEWTGLKHIVVTEGYYWKDKVKVAGHVKGLRAEDGQTYVRMILEGTTSESLLRYGSGKPGREVDLMVCLQDCDHELCAEGLIHVVKVEPYTEEKREGWMTNLVAAAAPEEDQLEKLRQEAGAVDPRLEREKSKDPKKLRKLSRERRKETKRTVSQEKERDRSKEKSKKDSPRVRGQADLEDIYADTALDPSPTVRRKLMRRAARLAKKKKKKTKKKKKQSDSSSNSSSNKESGSSSGSEVTQLGGRVELFSQGQVAKNLLGEYPGALTLGSIQSMQEHLMDATGRLWRLDVSEVPPLFLQYFRGQLATKMSPPMRREGLHLSYALDLMIQGRVAAAADVLSQRLKSLEGQSNGLHWTVTSQLEVVPQEQAMVATSQEAEEAARRAREEGRIKAQASKPYGSGNLWERQEEWKKGKGKHDLKKGNYKGDKGQKGDGYKRDETDQEKAKRKGG